MTFHYRYAKMCEELFERPEYALVHLIENKSLNFRVRRRDAHALERILTQQDRSLFYARSPLTLKTASRSLRAFLGLDPDAR